MPRDTQPRPLCNIEAEQALLGALLLTNAIIDKLPAGFDAEMFYDPVHGRIYRLATREIAEGRECSPITLKVPLASDEGLADLGGTQYLARLASSAISIAAAKDYARIIRDLWARRAALRALQEAGDRLSDMDSADDPSAALEGAQTALGTIVAATSPKPLVHSFTSALEEAAYATQAGYENDGQPLISTGLKALDKIIGGLQPADHIIGMGESSMGKTAIALELARAVARQGLGVFIGSLEMPKDQIAQRMVSAELWRQGHRVEYLRLLTGRVSEDEFRLALEAAAAMQAEPIVFAEDDCASLPKLMTAAHAARRQFERDGVKLGLVVIDYLQQITVPGSRSGYERVSEAARSMKTLAKALAAPVLSLCQMSRANVSREDKRPRKSDARQSGEIEESCDVMLGFYRHAYHIERELQGCTDSEEIDSLSAQLDHCRDSVEIIALKNRRGPLSTAYAYCDVAVNALADDDPARAEQEAFAI